MALAWTIQQPGVASVIAGARNAEQVRDNIDFLQNPLSDEVLRRTQRSNRTLKQMLGTNPDMWDAGANSRYR